MLDIKEFRFKVVTPLYLGGVDPRADEIQAKRDTQIRLRPVLAMWRYWFRALKGAELGTDAKGLEELEKQEQRLFGGVRGEHPTAAGIRARLVRVDNFNHSDYTEQEPHKSRYGRYLGYGLQEQKQRGVVIQNRRWAVKPGCEFTIAITAAQSDFDTLVDVIDTWVHCGGLGARHRRGWGCIEWTNRPRQVDYFKWLAERMKRYEGKMSTEPEFDVLHPDWCRIQICNAPSGEPFKSWGDALVAVRNQLRIDAGRWGFDQRLVQDNECKKLEDERVDPKKKQAVQLANPMNPPTLHLGESGYGWRQRWPDWRLSGTWGFDKKTQTEKWLYAFYQGRDHDEARKARQGWGCSPYNLKNIHFGLPVAYPTWDGMMVEPKLDDKPIRRPSPISFRISGANQNYRVTVLLFKSRFLPEGNCPIEANGRSVQRPEDWQDLDAFFDACHGYIVFGKGRK